MGHDGLYGAGSLVVVIMYPVELALQGRLMALPSLAEIVIAGPLVAFGFMVKFTPSGFLYMTTDAGLMTSVPLDFVEPVAGFAVAAVPGVFAAGELVASAVAATVGDDCFGAGLVCEWLSTKDVAGRCCDRHAPIARSAITPTTIVSCNKPTSCCARVRIAVNAVKFRRVITKHILIFSCTNVH